MARVLIKNLSKSFDRKVQAVDGLDLADVEDERRARDGEGRDVEDIVLDRPDVVADRGVQPAQELVVRGEAERLGA